jgi:2-polyprenyl-6-hydroxyphenyl methylase/3-demethylubiquinone-9 3-methyltransferase
MQEWRLTRIVDTSIHEWSMFITPAELGAALDRHGLELEELAGLAPRAPWPAIVGALRASRRGRIGYGELSRRLDFGRVESLALSYMGFAVRRG